MATRVRPPLRIPELEPFVVRNVVPTGVELGSGAYGAVEEVRIPGAICAAKKLHELLLKSATPQQESKMSETYLRECTLLSRLRHPHVVQFLGVCYLSGTRLPLLVMERLLTSLDWLLENREGIPYDPKVSFLRDVAQGLIFLHGQTPSPIIHRDLTARNVLLNTAMVAKIADLGVARIVDLQPDQLQATMTSNPGNVIYMPPEAVEEKAKYSTALDVFSYGNVAIFTLTQTFPKLKAATFVDPKTRGIVARSEIDRRIDLFEQLYEDLGEGHELVSLSKRCLSNDPEERPSANQILQQLSQVCQTGNWDDKTKLDLLQDVIAKERERAAKEKEVDNLEQRLGDQKVEIENLRHEKQSLQQQVESLQEQVQLLLRQNQEKEETNRDLEHKNRVLEKQLQSQHRLLQENRTQEKIDVGGFSDAVTDISSVQVLRKSFSYLYRYLDPVKVLPVLMERSLITASEAEEVASYQHNAAKSMAIVCKMFKSGVTRFKLFEALNRIPGQEYIGKRLTQEFTESLEAQQRRYTGGDIAEQFLQLLQDVMADFDDYPQGVEQLKQSLASLVLPLEGGKEAALVPPAVYQGAQTTRELFKCLSPYLNCLSVDLLQLLVHLSGCDAAASRVDDFLAARANNSHLVLCREQQQSRLSWLPTRSSSKPLDPHTASLSALQSARPQLLARLPEHQSVTIPEDSVRVSVRVNATTLYLSDYDNIVTALCGFFSITKAALAYIGCSEQPLGLAWLISPFLCEYMKSAGGGVSAERLVSQERITSIAVGQDISYTCLTTEESQLYEASYYGMVERVQQLVKVKDVDINKQSYDGGTALFFASQEGHHGIVELLIQAGANLDLQSNNGVTPLIIASFNGHQKVVEVLLSAGAKVDIRDKWSDTALTAARQKGHTEICQLLQEHMNGH